MPIQAEESFRARRGDAYTGRERDYLVTEDDPLKELDENDAITAAVNASPESVHATGMEEDLFRTNAQIARVISNNRMLITVQYGEAGAHGVAIAPQGSLEYEFAYQAPSLQIYQSLKTVSVTTQALNGSSFVDPNHFHGAIGVSQSADTKDVEGVSTAPGNTTNVWTYTGLAIEPEYEVKVEALMGAVNSQPFKTRPVGSMRFVSCTSQRTPGTNKSIIRFGFQYEPNRTNIEIGSGNQKIIVLAKNGHDYLWVYRELKDVPNLGILLPSPKYAVVEQVFPYADLNQLGFGLV